MGTTKSKTDYNYFPQKLYLRVNESVYYYQGRLLQSTAPCERTPLLILRLITLVLLVVLLTTHVRSVRVFRWEQSVTGGVLVTYLMAVIGLILCSGGNRCGGKALQVYLCSTGAAFLAANSAAILGRWRSASELTRAMAELLFALGVPLRRQVMLKVWLSAAAALCMAVDLALVAFFATRGADRPDNDRLKN